MDRDPSRNLTHNLLPKALIRILTENVNIFTVKNSVQHFGGSHQHTLCNRSQRYLSQEGREYSLHTNSTACNAFVFLSVIILPRSKLGSYEGKL